MLTPTEQELAEFYQIQENFSNQFESEIEKAEAELLKFFQEYLPDLEHVKLNPYYSICLEFKYPAGLSSKTKTYCLEHAIRITNWRTSYDIREVSINSLSLSAICVYGDDEKSSDNNKCSLRRNTMIFALFSLFGTKGDSIVQLIKDSHKPLDEINAEMDIVKSKIAKVERKLSQELTISQPPLIEEFKQQNIQNPEQYTIVKILEPLVSLDLLFRCSVQSVFINQEVCYLATNEQGNLILFDSKKDAKKYADNLNYKYIKVCQLKKLTLV